MIASQAICGSSILPGRIVSSEGSFRFKSQHSGTMKLILCIIIVVIVLTGLGFLIYQNLPSSVPADDFQKLKRIVDEAREIITPDSTAWSHYQNNNFGFEIAFPGKASVYDETRGRFPAYSDPAHIIFASEPFQGRENEFYLIIYELNRNTDIQGINDIFHLAMEMEGKKITSSKEVATSDGTKAKIIRGVVYPLEKDGPYLPDPQELASVLFIHGAYAYELEWDGCFKLDSCYSSHNIISDNLEKIIASIKFTK